MGVRLGPISRLCVLLILALPAPLGAANSVIHDCRNCPAMVVLPAAPDIDGRWAVSRTEITFGQYQACIDDGACRGGQDDHGWGRGLRPVINVAWSDARDYAAWLTGRTGHVYTLPHESLWEYAAGGNAKALYPWGNDVGVNHANCRDCGSRWSGKSTAPVASFKPNGFGLFDMGGNVWEWTADCWQADPSATPESDVNDNACQDRVIRGGAWYYFSPMSRVTARARFASREWSYTLGIRVVRQVEPGETK